MSAALGERSPAGLSEEFRIFVEGVLSNLGSRRLLLMLDEFHKIQEGIDSHVTSSQVPENIRSLFHEFDKVSGILTGERRIKQLRQKYWSALYGIGKAIEVGPLDRSSASALVTQPAQGQLVYNEEALERILELCACQPYLLQLLCDSIFEECHETDQFNVTTNLVDEAAEKFVSDAITPKSGT